MASKGCGPQRLGSPLKLKDACWNGYKAIGMKSKEGKRVPNCVPKK